jgi:dinuclear metal center YbgI/SA1388 family protein
MISLASLLDFVNEVLQPKRFQDYCPNGLQVEGRPEVRKIVTGVTACQALLDQAIDAQADVILVHHGFFWRGDDPCLIGRQRNRVKSLLQADVSLIAYHLPLDAHPELGNNVVLAKVLDLLPETPLNEDGIGSIGRLKQSMKATEFAAHIHRRLGRKPLHIPAGGALIETIAWCSGAAQGYIDNAVAAGASAYLSGEVSEQTVHIAREENIHYFAVGHHASERYGVQALGHFLAERFDLQHEFIDIDNPV